MIYELRIYRIAPGRLADGLYRFNRLPEIFRSIGINCLGRWQCSAGPDGPAIAYLMSYRDFVEREAQWDAFYGNAHWHALRAESNAGEEMVERFDLMFLKASAAWHPEAASTAPSGTVHELRIFRIGVGQLARANQLFEQALLPAIADAGGRVMLLADQVSGADLPAAAMIIEWPGLAAWQAGSAELETLPALVQRLRADRGEAGGETVGPSRRWLLQPIDDPSPRDPLTLDPAK